MRTQGGRGDRLAPLGSDSAIRTTLRTNPTLRQRLEAIANDTLTWGYVAGQAALSRYLGYHFRPWLSHGGALVARAATRAAKAAAAAPQQEAQVSLYPNPATDVFTLDYRLPAGTADARLLLVDKFGHACRTRALAGTAGRQEVSLAGLPFGVYAWRVVAREQPVRSGTLVKLP